MLENKRTSLDKRAQNRGWILEWIGATWRSYHEVGGGLGVLMSEVDWINTEGLLELDLVLHPTPIRMGQ